MTGTLKAQFKAGTVQLRVYSYSLVNKIQMPCFLFVLLVGGLGGFVLQYLTIPIQESTVSPYIG